MLCDDSGISRVCKWYSHSKSAQGLAYSISGGWNTSPIDHPGLFVAGASTASPAELLDVLGSSLQVREGIAHSGQTYHGPMLLLNAGYMFPSSLHVVLVCEAHRDCTNNLMSASIRLSTFCSLAVLLTMGFMVQRVQLEGVTEAEVAGAKGQTLNSFVFNFASTAAQLLQTIGCNLLGLPQVGLTQLHIASSAFQPNFERRHTAFSMHAAFKCRNLCSAWYETLMHAFMRADVACRKNEAQNEGARHFVAESMFTGKHAAWKLTGWCARTSCTNIVKPLRQSQSAMSRLLHNVTFIL